MELNIDEIEKILPQGSPFLLVDRITDYEPGVYAKGIKCVSINEPFFQGHFPGRRVMPGVLLIEAMVQTGSVIVLTEGEKKDRHLLLVGIRKSRFRRAVCPGDMLYLTAEMIIRKGQNGLFRGTASVDGEIIAEAEWSCSIQE